MQSFKKLIVWQKAMQLVEEVYKLMIFLPNNERYALTDQIRRSVVSIPSNIAEGRGRNSDREFIYFLNIANGSAYELQTQLIICQRLGYLKDEQLTTAYELCDEICRIMNVMIKKLKANG
jgi:four helix bundle protein